MTQTAQFFYDANCRFCVASAERIRALDWSGKLEMVNFRAQGATAPYADFDFARAEKELLLRTPEGEWLGGFEAFRWMSARLPALMALAPVLHLPGMGWLGQRAYAWIADHRYLIMGRAAST